MPSSAKLIKNREISDNKNILFDIMPNENTFLSLSEQKFWKNTRKYDRSYKYFYITHFNPKNLLFLDRDKFIRNYSALNPINFQNKSNRNPQNIELKLKEVLNKRKLELRNSINEKKKNSQNFNDKSIIKEIDKINIKQAFYESFRIVQPKGLRPKSVAENIQRNNEIEINEMSDLILEQSQPLIEQNKELENFSSIIKEENEQKYDYSDILNNYSLLRLLQNCFAGIKKRQNESILNIMKNKKNEEGILIDILFYLLTTRK